MRKVFSCFGYKKSRRKSRNEDDEASGSSLPPRHGILDVNEIAQSSEALLPIAYENIAAATLNFRDDHCLGQGEYGKVYEGFIRNINKVVAIKKLETTKFNGGREFVTEMRVLNSVDHPNLVKMFGYSLIDDTLFLVYEFMKKGSVDNHLHDPQFMGKALDWNIRIKIALGSAKGLEYLHNSIRPPMLYRHMKSSNILLDDHYNPKLSDFGLSMTRTNPNETHISGVILGMKGYIAPEYSKNGKLSLKSDVYSFGIVLLEIITGRKAYIRDASHEERDIARWARKNFGDRKNALAMVDPLLQGLYPLKSLYNVLGICATCIQNYPDMRPDIKEVVEALAYVESVHYTPSRKPINVNQEESSSNRRRASF